jgi:hypothetical protein
MLPIKSWRIHYADGSTFDNTQGTMADAPRFGVACVTYYHIPEKYTTNLVPSPEGIIELEVIDHEKTIKFGLWMDTKGFYRIIDEAGQSSPP